MRYPPQVHISPAPAVGNVFMSIELDDEGARGGMLLVRADALASLPEAIAKAVEAFTCPQDCPSTACADSRARDTQTAR